MMMSNVSRVPAEFPQEKHAIADGGALGPMSQQGAADSHGHEMHPQKFVRLVGCHESNAGRHEAGYRLH
jgi:hypothetical protein